MPVRQPVLDTNYKHISDNADMNLDKTTIIITIITIVIIIAKRGNSHKIGIKSYNHQSGTQTCSSRRMASLTERGRERGGEIDRQTDRQTERQRVKRSGVVC